MQVVFFITLILILIFSFMYIKEIGNRNKLGKLDLLIRLCVVILLCIIYYENLMQTSMLKGLVNDVSKGFLLLGQILRDEVIPQIQKEFLSASKKFEMMQLELSQVMDNVVIAQENSNNEYLTKYNSLAEAYVGIKNILESLVGLVGAK